MAGNKILIHTMMLLLLLTDLSFADQYFSGGKRDPFVPLVGVGRSSVKQRLEEIYSIDDVNLQGILMGSGGRKGVIVNGEVIYEGEKKGIFQIDSIGDNSVKVIIGDEYFDIKLYEE